MAITQEQRNEITAFAKHLKEVLQYTYHQKFRVSTSSSVRTNPYIEVRVWTWETDIMPNELRRMAYTVAYGQPDPHVNWDDINSGNIRAGGITISYAQWKKLLAQFGLEPTSLF
jgi:hypothetical protein